MTNPTTLRPSDAAEPSGHRTAIGVIALMALAISAAMLVSMLSRADAPFDGGPVPPPPVVAAEPAPTVPDAASVFLGHDAAPEPQPPGF